MEEDAALMGVEVAGGIAGRDDDLLQRPDGALAGAVGESYWLAQDGAPPPAPPLTSNETADLAVVGAGYGYFTANRRGWR